MQEKTFIVSTDLDGTLLDHFTYSWAAASDAIEYLKEERIPIVINTSKTALEVIALQQQLDICDPFIVENGSAVFVHSDDSRFDQHDLIQYQSSNIDLSTSQWHYHLLGQSREQILQTLTFARTQFNWQFSGFNDMSAEDIMSLTGLGRPDSLLAKSRGFSEPILWADSSESLIEFKGFLHKNQLTLLKGGRFYHVLGETNKGIAIQWLRQRMTSPNAERYKLIALGDSYNDIDMLSVSDYPVLVKSPNHEYPDFKHKNLIKTKEEGPIGWGHTILQLAC